MTNSKTSKKAINADAVSKKNTSNVNTNSALNADAVPKVNTSKVSTSKVSTSNVSTSKVNTSNVSTSNANTSKANTSKVNTSKVNTTSKAKALSKADVIPIDKNNEAVNVNVKDNVEVNGNEEDVANKSIKRYFKCILIDTDGNPICQGRYCGKKPKQAAGKACTKLFKQYKNKDIPKQIIFGMHECTRSSKRKKKYFYYGTRKFLGENPQLVTIKKIDLDTGNNVVIKYNYSNVVKKLTHVNDYPEYNLLSCYDAKDDDIQNGGAKIKVATIAKKGSKKTSKAVAKNTTKTATKNTTKTATKNTTKKTQKIAAVLPIVNNESKVKVNTKPATDVKKTAKNVKKN